jgi:hypothetical protein
MAITMTKIEKKNSQMCQDVPGWARMYQDMPGLVL